MTEPLEHLATTVEIWAQTLWSGHALQAPVADLELAFIGGQEGTPKALAGYLQRHLERASASRIARFSLPSGVRLQQVPVVIPRLDLPRRLQIEHAMDVSVIILEADGDRWVVVPVLDHSFFVAEDEDLEETVASEVRRMAAVLKPTPAAYLDLFPPQTAELQTLEVRLSRDAGGAGGAKARRKLVERKRRARALEVLGSVARPLHRAPGYRPGPEIIGLKDEQERLQSALSGEARTSVLLLGEARVGKSELVWSVIRKLHGTSEARPVWATSGAQLIAGMAFS